MERELQLPRAGLHPGGVAAGGAGPEAVGPGEVRRTGGGNEKAVGSVLGGPAGCHSGMRARAIH